MIATSLLRLRSSCCVLLPIKRQIASIKTAYKQYGKWLIIVHAGTSVCWFTSIASVVYMGLTFNDVLNKLQKEGMISDERAEKWTNLVKNSKPSDLIRLIRADSLMKQPQQTLDKIDGRVSTEFLVTFGTILAFYKIFTPFRYATTIGLTHQIVRRLPK